MPKGFLITIAFLINNRSVREKWMQILLRKNNNNDVDDERIGRSYRDDGSIDCDDELYRNSFDSLNYPNKKSIGKCELNSTVSFSFKGSMPRSRYYQYQY